MTKKITRLLAGINRKKKTLKMSYPQKNDSLLLLLSLSYLEKDSRREKPKLLITLQ